MPIGIRSLCWTRAPSSGKPNRPIESREVDDSAQLRVTRVVLRLRDGCGTGDYAHTTYVARATIEGRRVVTTARTETALVRRFFYARWQVEKD